MKVPKVFGAIINIAQKMILKKRTPFFLKIYSLPKSPIAVKLS